MAINRPKNSRKRTLTRGYSQGMAMRIMSYEDEGSSVRIVEKERTVQFGSFFKRDTRRHDVYNPHENSFTTRALSYFQPLIVKKTGIIRKPIVFSFEVVRKMVLCTKPSPLLRILMRTGSALEQIVREMIKRRDLAAMGAMLAYLRMISGEFDVADLIDMLIAAMMELLGNNGGDGPRVTREMFNAGLVTLMEMRDGNGKLLFKHQTHWVAVMRVAVDVDLIADKQYTGFKRFIESLKIKELRIPISVKLLSRVYQGVYAKPLTSWSWEAYCKQSHNSVHPKSYTEMEAVAKNLDSLVHTLAQAS